MNKIIKPASLLLYFLSVLVFFFIGMFIAGITGIAKDKGLAGGAIIFGYGVIAASIALLVAIFISYFSNQRTVVILNRILALLFIICIVIFIYLFTTQKKERAVAFNLQEQIAAKYFSYTTLLLSNQQQDLNNPMGLGFFKPNFYENSVLYFYGNPNPEKPVNDHSPTDSIVFERNEYGSFMITYAPPWLVPEHLKLDYDLLYFKVLTVGKDFAEIVVNKTTKRTAYINRNAGKMIYWPDFLLTINSVELITPEEQKIRYKPLAYAGEVNLVYAFMSPVQIKSDWMLVTLRDNDFKELGKGWIQWKKDDKLLIRYSLLS